MGTCVTKCRRSVEVGYSRTTHHGWRLSRLTSTYRKLKCQVMRRVCTQLHSLSFQSPFLSSFLYSPSARCLNPSLTHSAYSSPIITHFHSLKLTHSLTLTHHTYFHTHFHTQYSLSQSAFFLSPFHSTPLTVFAAGQYNGDRRPMLEYHVKIAGFDEKVRGCHYCLHTCTSLNTHLTAASPVGLVWVNVCINKSIC